MITRGHFIGEIVDDLTSLTHQITTRNKLGLYDLNVFIETFFKDLLNALYDWRLENLNRERSNEPGLDLGDKSLEIAIQVTSRSDVAKVNNTLKKITSAQAKAYKQIYVFVAGSKLGRYNLDADLCTRYSFSEKNILDVKDLCRKTMDLPIEKLHELHRIIRTNVRRLSIELEVPDPETGKYPTSGFDKWEVKPQPKVGNGKAFAKWFANEYDISLDSEEIKGIEEDLVRLGQRLRRLPRVTREFLAMLFERRSPNESGRFSDHWKSVRYATVAKEYRGIKGELDDELALLMDESFVTVSGEDPDSYGAPEIGMYIPDEGGSLSAGFLAYVKAKNLDLRNIFGQVDLSAF